jgi:hypothetical protein
MFTGHLHCKHCTFESEHIATGSTIYGEWFETFQDSATRGLRHITFTTAQVKRRFPDLLDKDGKPTERALERFVAEQRKDGEVSVTVAFRDENQPLQAACPLCGKPLFIRYTGIM